MNRNEEFMYDIFEDASSDFGLEDIISSVAISESFFDNMANKIKSKISDAKNESKLSLAYSVAKDSERVLNNKMETQQGEQTLKHVKEKNDRLLSKINILKKSGRTDKNTEDSLLKEANYIWNSVERIAVESEDDSDQLSNDEYTENLKESVDDDTLLETYNDFIINFNPDTDDTGFYEVCLEACSDFYEESDDDYFLEAGNRESRLLVDTLRKRLKQMKKQIKIYKKTGNYKEIKKISEEALKMIGECRKEVNNPIDSSVWDTVKGILYENWREIIWILIGMLTLGAGFAVAKVSGITAIISQIATIFKDFSKGNLRAISFNEYKTKLNVILQLLENGFKDQIAICDQMMKSGYSKESSDDYFLESKRKSLSDKQAQMDRIRDKLVKIGEDKEEMFYKRWDYLDSQLHSGNINADTHIRETNKLIKKDEDIVDYINRKYDKLDQYEIELNKAQSQKTKMINTAAIIAGIAATAIGLAKIAKKISNKDLEKNLTDTANEVKQIMNENKKLEAAYVSEINPSKKEKIKNQYNANLKKISTLSKKIKAISKKMTAKNK